MIGFRRLVIIEVRKRTDTRAAIVGWSSLAALVIAAGALSTSVVTRAPEFGVGEVIVTTGLPAALACAIVGVVVGVGDPDGGSERDALTAGISRRRAYFARSAAAAAFVAGLVLVTVVIAMSCTGVSLVLGGHPTFDGAGIAVAELSTLAITSGAFGFGIGASVRSLALGLVGCVLVVLVVDTSLSFVGPIGQYVQFSSVQSALTGSGSIGPALTAAILWIVAPFIIGWRRSERAQ